MATESYSARESTDLLSCFMTSVPGVYLPKVLDIPLFRSSESEQVGFEVLKAVGV
jgi:hypothetical protein